MSDQTFPWAELMDDAEAAYWDAENMHGTDAGIQALAEWAWHKGRESTFMDSAEEWVVTFQDSPYAQPQRYASEFSREDATEAAAEAVRLGYKSVRVRVRYRSSWSDVAVEAGEQR